MGIRLILFICSVVNSLPPFEGNLNARKSAKSVKSIDMLYFRVKDNSEVNSQIAKG